MRFSVVLRVVAIWCLSLTVVAVPVAWDSSEQQWLSQRSSNFEIFYQAGNEALAEHSLTLAEQVHIELLPFFTDHHGRASLPPEPTRLVLVDDFDFSNGWATPLPFAQIRLYASPPQDVNSLESNDDWLHSLIRHEYVHVLHTEMARALPRLGRNIFGRTPFLPILVPMSPFPHAFTPAMMLEGLAVYLETDKAAGYGRLQSSFYDMLMRTEVASGELQSLGEVVATGRHFPTNRAYLYGAFFIEFLVETYGEDKLKLYLQRYSGELIAFFMQQDTARRVYGKSFNALWQEFQVYLRQRFTPQIAELSQSSVPVTVVAEDIPVMPVMAQSQRQLMTVRNNREDQQALQWLSAQGQQTLVAQSGMGYIDIASDGRVLVSRLMPYVSGRAWNDLFIWQADRGWRRLTERQRYRKARWLNDSQIIASRNVRGISELVLLNVNEAVSSNRGQLLWRGDYGDVLGDFALQNGQLVAAIKRPGQGWNLELATLDLSASDDWLWQAITDTRAVENSPEFLADGRVIFSADYDGVFNIYALTTTTGELQQLTSTLTGAFNPQVIKTDQGVQLYYARYQHDGYQVVAQAFEPRQTSSQSIHTFAGRFDYPPVAVPSQPKGVSAVNIYAPDTVAFWRSIRPHSWLPVFLSNDENDRLGVVTSGNDALGRHRYSLMLNRDRKQQQTNALISYNYDNRWLVTFSREHDTLGRQRSADGQLVDVIQRDDTWLVQRSFLTFAAEDQLHSYIGLVAERKQIVDTSLARNETLFGIAWSFDNRQAFLDVPGVGWGSYADVIIETNDLLESDFSGNRYQGRYAHTFDLPGRVSLTYDGAAGYADPGAETFVLGSENGEENRLFGRNKYRLRGYQSGVQEGHKIHRQSLSMAWPLARIDDNWNLNPVGIADVSASLFVDTGKAWFDHQHRSQLVGIGAELTTELILGYRALAPIKLGFAKGLNKANGATTHIYLSFGLPL